MDGSGRSIRPWARESASPARPKFPAMGHEKVTPSGAASAAPDRNKRAAMDSTPKPSMPACLRGTEFEAQWNTAPGPPTENSHSYLSSQSPEPLDWPALHEHWTQLKARSHGLVWSGRGSRQSRSITTSKFYTLEVLWRRCTCRRQIWRCCWPVN